VEGEPRWEYKFIRRGGGEDHGVQVVSMLRTTENKIYRQGISDPSELADGFPTKAEDLFKYGDHHRERGGGVLYAVAAGAAARVCGQARRRGAVSGRAVFAERWRVGVVERDDLLPTFLPNAKETFHREPATVQLTAAGAESAGDAAGGRSREEHRALEKLPYMNDYQDPGTPKPGATVLAQMTPGGRCRCW
jgi:hypothetical protein